MCLEFFKFPLSHLQNLSFLAHWPWWRGRSFLKIERVILYVVGKFSDYGQLWENLSLKMKFKEYLGEKSTTFFTIWDSVYLLCLKCFSKWPYFWKPSLSWNLVARLVDHYGWLKKETFGFGPARKFTLSIISYSGISLF